MVVVPSQSLTSRLIPDTVLHKRKCALTYTSNGHRPVYRTVHRSVCLCGGESKAEVARRGQFRSCYILFNGHYSRRIVLVNIILEFRVAMLSYSHLRRALVGEGGCIELWLVAAAGTARIMRVADILLLKQPQTTSNDHTRRQAV